MPKEITHWTLAAAVVKKLPENSLFYKPIRSFPHLFLLGAVTPDIPFYYLAGPKAAQIQNLSAPFHGTDARALLPVLAFLDKNQDQHQTKEPAVLAFAAGVICHILSDTLFHPLVYYFAGMDGVHPGATARHRQFETAMDLYFWYLSQDRSQVSLARVVRNSEVSKRQLHGFLIDLFQAKSVQEKRYLGYALYSHMTLQYLFRSQMVHKTLAFLDQKTSRIPNKLMGVIYPCTRSVNLPFFGQKFTYQDPCTGTLFSSKITEMMEETALAGQRLFKLISNRLAQGKPAIGVLDNPDLPRIKPGFARDRSFLWREKYDLEAELYSGIDFNCVLLKTGGPHDCKNRQGG